MYIYTQYIHMYVCTYIYIYLLYIRIYNYFFPFFGHVIIFLSFNWEGVPQKCAENQKWALSDKRLSTHAIDYILNQKAFEMWVCIFPIPSLMFTCTFLKQVCIFLVLQANIKNVMWFYFKWHLHSTQGEVWPLKVRGVQQKETETWPIRML